MSTKKVLLTRSNNAELARILLDKGIDVMEIPLIKTELSYSREDAKDIIETLGTYDWITFSSVQGVRGFFAALFDNVDDIRAVGLARFACVGEATANELRALHLSPCVIPEASNGMAMVEAMAEFESLDNLKVLCVRGNLSNPELVKTLETKYGAIVDTFEVYKTSMCEISKEQGAQFRKEGADVVVFSSPSAVESFANNAPSLILSTKAIRPKLVAIGPVTAQAIKKFNMKLAAEAKSPQASDVADAILNIL